MKFGGIGGIPGRRGGKPIGGGKFDAGGTPRAGKFGGGTPGGIFIGGIPGGGPLIGGIGIGGIANFKFIDTQKKIKSYQSGSKELMNYFHVYFLNFFFAF